MTLTVLVAPFPGNTTRVPKDLGRHLASVSSGGEDSMHTLDDAAEPGRHNGLSTLKGSEIPDG